MENKCSNQLGCRHKTYINEPFLMEEKSLDSNKEQIKEMTTMSNSSYFWKPHTITVLFALLFLLFYVTFLEDDSKNSTEYNAKRGILACCGVFIAFGMTQARDGPIVRPHPVVWRLVLCCSVIYETALIFLLFQTADDARHWMSSFDEELGKPLPEQDYGGNCLIYDSSKVGNPWQNFKDKLDVFVVAHLLGWWAKTLILRDYWITMVLSCIFELAEYSLQHQLPNFSECWWDHWILDFIICNGGGIYAGMITLRYLEMKAYNWRDLWSIPTFSGKFKRFFQQFTPYSWRKFNWNATRDLKHWLSVLAIIVMFTFAELNVFYLKSALWIPSKHRLIMFRLVLFFLMGFVAVREIYDYLTDSTCKRFGQQSWLITAIIITEIFISVKFIREVVSLTPPLTVTIFWILVSILVLLYTCWLFLLTIFGIDSNENMKEMEKKSLKTD